MTEQQARELAADIELQLSHVETAVTQSADMRNAPQNWFIVIYRKNAPEPRIGLYIHNKYEWLEAQTALYVLAK